MEVISSKEFFHKGLLIERTPNIKGQRPGQKRLAVKLSSCNDNLENKKPPQKTLCTQLQYNKSNSCQNDVGRMQIERT